MQLIKSVNNFEGKALKNFILGELYFSAIILYYIIQSDRINAAKKANIRK